MIGWIEARLGDGIVAGFTTRAGGVSRAPWDGLNLGLNVGDDPADVLTNRSAVAEFVGVPVAFAHQVHGRSVIHVESPTVARQASVGDGDILITRRDDVAIAVLAADCVPVLLADPFARVVGAIHAGRVGLMSGVIDAGVAALIAEGANADRLVAVIGPAIDGLSYEVPEAMRDDVEARIPGAGSQTSWGTPGLDLVAGVSRQLRASGVDAVTTSGLSTWTDKQFFSHRRSGDGRTGRQCAVIRLTPFGRVLPAGR